MAGPRRFGLRVSAGGLPGAPAPPARTPTGARLTSSSPPAGVEFQRPLGAAAAIGLNLRVVPGRSLRSMPPNTPPDGSAAAAAVPIIASDLPGPSPRAGIVTDHRRP